MVKNLGLHNSLLNQFIGELRDADIQADSLRFRRNMERVGEIFAYEISKELDYVKQDVTTSLGISEVNVLKSKPILATILRAGLPMHYGMLNYFDTADNAFISAYRKHSKDGTFKIKIEYISSPDITDKILILSDPMLATGASMVLAYQEILNCGKPKHTYFTTVVACTQGIEYISKHVSKHDASIWVGAIDEELTAQSYIVPGLGDAGDLAFGSKVQY